jgi:hypothetical protein
MLSDNASRLQRLLLNGFGGGDMSVLDEVVLPILSSTNQACLRVERV